MAVTIKDVARVAGTSVAAVSVTLNGSQSKTIRVGEETRRRIFAAAAQLGYVSNPIAKSLATGKTGAIGLVLPYADAFIDQNPFCNEVMSGILHEAVVRQYNIMLFTATNGIALDQVAMHLDSRVEGLLLVMPPAESALYLKCERRKIPCVSILREPEPEVWTVNANDFEGGRLAAKHLAKLGHKRVAILEGSDDVISSALRKQGFCEACAEAGIQVVCEPSGLNWRMGETSMKRLLSRPRSDWPTAVFCANDLCAEGAMRAAREFGLSIPEEMAFVGCDDTWFATMTQPPLTSVHMPLSEMGSLAAKMLISRLEGETVENIQPVLPVSLTVRQSCGQSQREQSGERAS